MRLRVSAHARQRCMIARTASSETAPAPHNNQPPRYTVSTAYTLALAIILLMLTHRNYSAAVPPVVTASEPHQNNTNLPCKSTLTLAYSYSYIRVLVLSRTRTLMYSYSYVLVLTGGEDAADELLARHFAVVVFILPTEEVHHTRLVVIHPAHVAPAPVVEVEMLQAL